MTVTDVPAADLFSPHGHGPIQMGFWVPNRVWATAQFLVPLRREVGLRRRTGSLTPTCAAVREFQEWTTKDPAYRMRLTSMIDQANTYVAELPEEIRKKISQDGGVLWLPDAQTFFDVLNEIVNTSPGFNRTVMVGTPLDGLLTVAMATESGLALFHDQTFNEHFRPVLDHWNAFLRSPGSLDKLDITDPEKPGSWISREAWDAGVWTDLEFDPTATAYGFDSWNSFFIRRFRAGVRTF
jgi:phosphatidylserine decarboxylase